MKSKTIQPKVEKKFNSPENNLSIECISGADHYRYNIFYKGIWLTMLQISHSSKEFGTPLKCTMARQLGITKKQLEGIEECNFWGKDFVEHCKLIEK